MCVVYRPCDWIPETVNSPQLRYRVRFIQTYSSLLGYYRNSIVWTGTVDGRLVVKKITDRVGDGRGVHKLQGR